MTAKTKRGYGYRPPDQVVDQRIAEACAVLALKPSSHRCELHKLFSSRWTNKVGEPCHWKTVDRIVARAKLLLIERTKRPKDAWIDDLLAGYDRDISDADAKVRLAARQGIRQMLGLDAPSQHQLSGPGGEPLMSGNTSVTILWPHESRNGNGGNGNGNGGNGKETHETEPILASRPPGVAPKSD